jgi:hypothetical protein
MLSFSLNIANCRFPSSVGSSFLVQRTKLLTPSVVQSTGVQGHMNYNDRNGVSHPVYQTAHRFVFNRSGRRGRLRRKSLLPFLQIRRSRAVHRVAFCHGLLLDAALRSVDRRPRHPLFSAGPVATNIRARQISTRIIATVMITGPRMRPGGPKTISPPRKAMRR